MKCYNCETELSHTHYTTVGLHLCCSNYCRDRAEYIERTEGIGSPPVPSRLEIPPPPPMRSSDRFVHMEGDITGNPGGLKYDDGKIPLHLLPFDAILEITKVLDFGQKKYSANNWRKGFVWSRVFRAAVGHLISWWMGQDLDEETGISHLAHAGCCVIFLLHFVLKQTGTDDRSENNT